EDSILMCHCEGDGLFLVADGIGGREHGEVASGQIRDGYQQWWQEQFLPRRGAMDFQTAMEGVRNTLLQVNRDLVSQFGEMNTGSTLVLLFLYGGNCAYLSAGDSRIYRIRNLSIKQISTDDVYQAQANDRNAWQNGRLMGAVGIRLKAQFMIRTDTVRNGDKFFLCSDGVYRYAGSNVLRSELILKGSFGAPRNLVARIEKDVLKHGAGDNYSMIFLRARK
ncbi:MAG: protein phosphatase 2C domain-containing protein, partial [Oscillibacter sp.]|nr:protein phosphatase 2C domain-containing protein [Oscillibacter sp.]